MSQSWRVVTVLAHDQTRSKRTPLPAGASGAMRVAADRTDEAASVELRATETARCSLCARDTNYGTVFKAGRIYCSIECAEAMAGLYLG